MLHYSHIQPSPPDRAPQPRPIRGGRASPSPGDKQWCPPRLRSHIRNAHPCECTRMHAHTHTHVSMHACQHAQTRSGTARAHTSVSTAPQAHMCTPACAHTPHARALCTHAHRGHTRTGAHTHTRAHAHIPCAPMRSPAHGTHAAHAHTNTHAHNPSLYVVLQSSLTSTGL